MNIFSRHGPGAHSGFQSEQMQKCYPFANADIAYITTTLPTSSGFSTVLSDGVGCIHPQVDWRMYILCEVNLLEKENHKEGIMLQCAALHSSAGYLESLPATKRTRQPI
jgi:hypothetical protein